ncbi:MAG: sigma-70 family RNA polymerase sigma factor [Actinomycetota bacterium]|nr:sigma-70 family RNA polymerase sigma factor [Actinomycetota bacterium]
MGPTPSKLSTAEIQALVERARRDDPDAWEALYRLSYTGLLAYARRRLWGFTEADDAVSETFARAYPRIVDFEWTGSGFNAWLFGILRNVMMEAGRRDQRSRMVDGRPGRIEDECLDGLLHDEEATAVRVAFATLGPDDREILELRVVGGLDAEEVASVVGKRAGAVRMAQSRALVRLRTALDKVSTGG